jgi:ankyrin repeat protein
MRGNEKFVVQLLGEGADVNSPVRGEGGKIALRALRSWQPANGEEHERKLRLVQLLLEHGADINAATPARIAGFTCLQSAAAAGDIELAMFLINHCADINAPLRIRWSYCFRCCCLQGATGYGAVSA